MSKRKIERKIEELEHDTSDDHSGVLVLCEHDDGTITTPDGEPVSEEEYENASIVIDSVSWDVAETWPDTGDGSEVIEP